MSERVSEQGRKLRLLALWLCVVALCTACGGLVNFDPGGGDTATEFLRVCDATSECGASWACKCGVCTVACVDDGDCERLGIASTRCVSTPSCDTPAICANDAFSATATSGADDSLSSVRGAASSGLQSFVTELTSGSPSDVPGAESLSIVPTAGPSFVTAVASSSSSELLTMALTSDGVSIVSEQQATVLDAGLDASVEGPPLMSFQSDATRCSGPQDETTCVGDAVCHQESLTEYGPCGSYSRCYCYDECICWGDLQSPPHPEEVAATECANIDDYESCSLPGAMCWSVHTQLALPCEKFLDPVCDCDDFPCLCWANANSQFWP